MGGVSASGQTPQPATCGDGAAFAAVAARESLPRSRQGSPVPIARPPWTAAARVSQDDARAPSAEAPQSRARARGSAPEPRLDRPDTERRVIVSERRRAGARSRARGGRPRSTDGARGRSAPGAPRGDLPEGDRCARRVLVRGRRGRARRRGSRVRRRVRERVAGSGSSAAFFPAAVGTRRPERSGSRSSLSLSQTALRPPRGAFLRAGSRRASWRGCCTPHESSGQPAGTSCLTRA